MLILMMMMTKLRCVLMNVDADVEVVIDDDSGESCC